RGYTTRRPRPWWSAPVDAAGGQEAARWRTGSRAGAPTVARTGAGRAVCPAAVRTGTGCGRCCGRASGTVMATSRPTARAATATTATPAPELAPDSSNMARVDRTTVHEP